MVINDGGSSSTTTTTHRTSTTTPTIASRNTSGAGHSTARSASPAPDVYKTSPSRLPFASNHQAHGWFADTAVLSDAAAEENQANHGFGPVADNRTAAVIHAIGQMGDPSLRNHAI